MPGAVIRATRTEVSDRFPLLGFTVKTGAQPFFETVIMTSPELAANANKTQRTPETFWSSRSIGPLSTERGEAVFMVPDDVLRRFAGKQRLYYAVATFADRARTNPDVSRVDAASMPYVKLSPNFSRRRARQIVGSRSEHRRWNGKNGGGYGEVGPALEWAGDEATPGSEAATPLVGDAPDAPATGAGPATTAGVAVAYDDGFDGALWRGQPAGPDAPALGKPAVDVEWPGVMAIPETNGVSSWIAAAASIAAWLAGRAGQLGDLAARAGNLLKSGSIDSANLAAFAQAWDLVPASGTALGVQQFRDLLAGMGPLWIAAAGSPHAVVVSGLVGDGTSEGTRVRIKDPWTASSGAAGAYELSFTQFVNTFSTSGDAATAGMHVLHLKEGLVQSRAPGAPGLAAPALAQARSSLAGRRGNGAPVAARAAAAPVIVPIVSTIVGASLTRVMNNEGDVKWELDQMNGLKHPGDDVARGTAAAFVTAPVLRVEGWPKVETGLTD
ncbi:MAG: papain-like cysteine protease family protein, partial [Gemmatimonadaceae bacterium]